MKRKLDPPPTSSPIIQGNGALSNEYIRWFNQIFYILADVTAKLTDLEARIVQLESL